MPAARPAPISPGGAEHSPDTEGRRDLYRLVWRWHFFAGLAVAPVLLVVSISGALLTFAAEARPWLYPSRYAAAGYAPGAHPLPLEDQLRAALAAAGPGARLDAATLSPRPGATTRFTLAGGEEPPRVFAVDPYTAAVQAAFIPRTDAFDRIEAVHRSLLAGPAGRVVVELCTGWTVVLVLTGVFLWWPRGRISRGWGGGVFAIRWGKPAYTVLRDTHAVSGALLSLPLLAVVVTGMFLTLVNGSLLRDYVFGGGPGGPPGGGPGAGGAPPRTGRPAEGPRADGGPLRSGGERGEREARGERSGRGERGERPERSSPAADEPSVPPGLQAAADAAWANGLGASEFTLRPDARRGGYTATARVVGEGIMRTISLSIDAAGQAGPRSDSRPATIGAAVRGWGRTIHDGSVYGWPTKLLAALASLTLALLAALGAAMWWLRRPRGRTGFPPRVQGARVGWPVLTAAVILGAAMPLVGGSMLLVAGADGAWRWATRRRGGANSDEPRS